MTMAAIFAFACLLTLIEGHTETVHVEDANSDFNVTCRAGQSIADLWIKEEIGNRVTYRLECANMTDACDERCKLSLRCTGGTPKNQSYVKGIRVIDERRRDSQRIYFLCCSSIKPIVARCTGKLVPLKTRPNQAHGQHPTFFRRAVVVRRGRRLIVYVEWCENLSRTTQICRLTKSKIQVERTDPLATNYEAFERAALAAAGIVGAVVPSVIAAGVPASRSRSPCCCHFINEQCTTGCVGCAGFKCETDKCRFN